MRFLVDAQLPKALARFLTSVGHHTEHVADVGLLSADDPDIWDYAKHAGAAIVSKDEDFSDRIVLDPSGPPIVWVRRGNCGNADLLGCFTPLLPGVVASLQRRDKLIELS